MKKSLLGFICIIATIVSCKKTDTDAAGCWQCYDNQGSQLGSYCGNSQEDAFNKSGNINGVHDISNYREFCPKANLPKYCWKRMLENNDWRYMKATEFEVGKFFIPSGYNMVKVDCSIPCENWNTRRKYKNKLTNEFTYSNVTTYDYCGDTLTSIFKNRAVVINETAEVITYNEDISRN